MKSLVSRMIHDKSSHNRVLTCHRPPLQKTFTGRTLPAGQNLDAVLESKRLELQLLSKRLKLHDAVTRQFILAAKCVDDTTADVPSENSSVHG